MSMRRIYRKVAKEYGVTLKEAVSYTHLDVYKRQTTNTGTMWTPSAMTPTS